MVPLAELEAKIQYSFANRELLGRALTHSSVGGDAPAGAVDNEQLEFLGDAVLGLLASEALFRSLPDADEGKLSRLKSKLVSASHLYESALAIGLGDYVRLGRGEELSGGRERKSVLADALEALIAAIYLDGGLDQARRFVRDSILNPLDDGADHADIGEQNHKSLLQEFAVAHKLALPRYVTVESHGPEHAKQFTVEARVGDAYSARATASSKKAASQAAAEILLAQIKAASEGDG